MSLIFRREIRPLYNSLIYQSFSNKKRERHGSIPQLLLMSHPGHLICEDLGIRTCNENSRKYAGKQKLVEINEYKSLQSFINTTKACIDCASKNCSTSNISINNINYMKLARFHNYCRKNYWLAVLIPFYLRTDTSEFRWTNQFLLEDQPRECSSDRGRIFQSRTRRGNAIGKATDVFSLRRRRVGRERGEGEIVSVVPCTLVPTRRALCERESPARLSTVRIPNVISFPSSSKSKGGAFRQRRRHGNASLPETSPSTLSRRDKSVPTPSWSMRHFPRKKKL